MGFGAHSEAILIKMKRRESPSSAVVFYASRRARSPHGRSARGSAAPALVRAVAELLRHRVAGKRLYRFGPGFGIVHSNQKARDVVADVLRKVCDIASDHQPQ